jgi:RNA polymerase sigma factor (sigma-70 family)
MNDFDLLRAYVEQGAEDAFTELVNRHINLVYSAAMRQIRDPHIAAEITQSVFIILARKTATIRPGTILAGWLLRTTRYTAANARRREHHRHESEQTAMEQLYPTETEAAWKELRPLLDDAMVGLGAKDRDAVALRFFEQKSFKEIGAALSLSEDSARKRVSRAVERLRSILTKRDCTLSVAAIGAAISANATKAAPAGMTATVATAVLSKGVASAGSIPLLVQATLTTLNWLRWRSIGISAAIIVLALGLGIVSANHLAGKSRQPNRNAKIAPTLVEQSTPMATIHSVNSPLETPPQTSGKSILLRVLDADAQTPIARARLTLVWVKDSSERLTNAFGTDAKGESRVPIDATMTGNWNWRVEVYKDGYVPKYVSWSVPQGDTLDSFPPEYTVKLTHSIDIGGVVVNEAGEPVPEVRIVFSVNGPAPGASHDRERLTMMGGYHTEITDIEGKWHCNHVPQQFGMITYACMHPNYLTSQFGSAALATSSTMGFTYVAAAELQNGTAKTTLKPGILVAGAVVDESGHPIPHAKVTEDRYWSEPSASEQTGNGGRFQFANTSNKDLVLTVQANDFAPLEVTVHPGDQTDALRLTLSKGSRLRGRILNDFSEPIENAKIRLSSTESGWPKFEWAVFTGADGKFEWLSAPAEETYAISASGFDSQSKVSLTADSSEHEITLHRIAPPSPALHIAGTVVDSETRQPIESFRVFTTIIEGIRTPEGHQTHWIGSPELQVIGSAGKFSFNANKSALNHVVEIQTSGYSPARTDVEGPLDKDVLLAFELKHAAPLTGSVRSPDGAPVSGALVVLSCEETRQQDAFPIRMEMVYMKVPGGFDLTRTHIPHTTTDAEGRFSFEPKMAMKKILIAHTSGFAQVPIEQLATNPAVILHPWGRVVGTLQIGNAPGTNETLYLRNWGWAYLFSHSLEVHLEAKTDSEGRFSIEGVPPGDWEISHEVKLRHTSEKPKPVKVQVGRGYSMVLPRTSGPSLVTLLHVEPGATTEIKLGGTGRQVVGKLRAADIAQPIDWTRDVQRLTCNPGVSAVGPAAKRQDFNSEKEYFAAQQQWYGRLREFWLSEAGIRAKSAPHEYTAIFGADGTFRINDVLPGIYRFEIHLSDPNDPRGFPFGKTIATLTKEITVDAGGSEKASEPFNLGVLELIANEK